jgi:ribosomal protein L37AE/L43A
MRYESSARKGTDDERHRVVTDGGDEIAACPECDGSRVYTRESMSPRWRCADCGATFDEPTYRTPSHLRAVSTAEPDDTAAADDLEVGPSDLTAFQIEALRAIARIDDVQYGLAIKAKLERYYGEEVNHGRLYPNLDHLVERDLIEKSQLDNRTNHYALTSAGVRLLETRLDQLSSAVDAHHTTDESDRADAGRAMTDGGAQ